MSCRKAFEIDLPGFLEEPGSPAFAGFRDHYPRCRACSAEVRAWTELHRALRAEGGELEAAHPTPETLARYEGDREALDALARASLERHLAGCPSCREEVRGLAAFAPEALGAETGAPGTARRPALREILDGLRGVLWHPAFAYVLVGVLLVPVVYRALGPARDQPTPVSEVQAAARMRALGHLESEPSAPVEEAESDVAGDERRERKAARAPGPIAGGAEAERAQAPRAPIAPAEEPPRADRDQRRGFAKTLPAVREEEASELRQSSRADAPAASKTAAPPKAQRSLARPGAEMADAVELFGEAVGVAALRPSVPLRSGVPVAIAAAAAARGLRLRVPLPGSAPGGGQVEVRLFEVTGGRELRERKAAPPAPRLGRIAASRWVEVEVPPNWLGPGTYRVELHFDGEEGRAAEEVEPFELRVGTR